MGSELFATGSSAVIDDTGQYRYELIREWDRTKPKLAWLMLNPSTADAEQDDPTIRRCVGFSKSWGFGSLIVVNVFAYRTTYPQELKRVGFDKAIGPENADAIRSAYVRSGCMVAAFGAHSEARRRVHWYIAKRHLRRLWCLGRTKDGSPKHPLYVAANVWPTVWHETWGRQFQ